MVHPLMLLRTGMGLSHPEYARLVADRHAGLGHGRMAARREKVSRWESGRIVPEYTAQLAMADIHDVPAEEVGRLGWPHWLYLAVGDGLLREEYCGGDGAVAVLRGSVHLAEAASPPELVLQGSALATQLTAAIVRANAPGHGQVRDGPPATVERLDWLSARIAVLEQQFTRTQVPPAALYAAAVAEHRLVVRLLATLGNDRSAGRRLFLLGARTGLLCAWVSNTLGEQARAERQTLAAMRAAAAAGDPVLVSEAMLLLALRHLDAGDPGDARLLVRAARTADPNRPADFAAASHAAEALALARAGEAARAARSLDRAAEAAVAHADAAEPGAGPDADTHRLMLFLARARVALDLGRPQEARRYVDVVSRILAVPRANGMSPHTGLFFLGVLDAHLALGEVDRAAAVVEQAVAITGALPPALALRYRERVTPFLHEPLVRRAADRLTEAGAV
ncbi:hypothetical protein [Kitasatospora purpeofusca]|uniref:hypothetical protein n=1 Tax=Kitasatospora purpeofusca TaxID=67352 RepID=UPI0036A3555D